MFHVPAGSPPHEPSAGHVPSAPTPPQPPPQRTASATAQRAADSARRADRLKRTPTMTPRLDSRLKGERHLERRSDVPPGSCVPIPPLVPYVGLAEGRGERDGVVRVELRI